MRISLLCLFTLLFVALSSFSQVAPEMDIETLDSVFITAPVDVELPKTASAKVVLETADIAGLSATNFEELLSQLSGFSANQRGQFGSQIDFSIWGSTFTQVLVLLDGERINDPLTGHFNNNLPIPLSAIHSIELIKGPGSLQWGADAVGGIIHIHSKLKKNPAEKTSAQFSGDLSMTDAGAFITDFNSQFGNENATLGFAVRQVHSPGVERENPNHALGFGPESKRNFLFQNLASISAGFTISPTVKAFGRLSYESKSFDAQYYYTRSAFDESVEEVKTLWTQFGLERESGAHKSGLSGSYKRTEDEFLFNPLFPANLHEVKRFNGRLFHQFERGNGLYEGGLSFEHRSIISTDRGEHERENVGGYLKVWDDFGSPLFFDIGLRLHHEMEELNLLPHIGVVYDRDKYRLRAKVAQAVRSPDFTENYVSHGLPSLSAGRNYGNANLVPEKSWTIDGGIDFSLNERQKLSLTGFYRESENLIDYVLTSGSEIPNEGSLTDTFSYFHPQNIFENEKFGIDFQWSGSVSVNPNNSLKTNLAYTFLNDLGDSAETSKYISLHPEHVFSIMAIWKNKAFDFSVDYVFQQRDPEIIPEMNAEVLENYGVLNMGLSFYPLCTRQLALFTKVHNLTDESYQEIVGASLPSRWWRFGLRWAII